MQSLVVVTDFCIKMGILGSVCWPVAPTNRRKDLSVRKKRGISFSHHEAWRFGCWTWGSLGLSRGWLVKHQTAVIFPCGVPWLDTSCDRKATPLCVCISCRRCLAVFGGLSQSDLLVPEMQWIWDAVDLGTLMCHRDQWVANWKMLVWCLLFSNNGFREHLNKGAQEAVSEIGMCIDNSAKFFHWTTWNSTGPPFKEKRFFGSSSGKKEPWDMQQIFDGNNSVVDICAQILCKSTAWCWSLMYPMACPEASMIQWLLAAVGLYCKNQ